MSNQMVLSVCQNILGTGIQEDHIKFLLLKLHSKTGKPKIYKLNKKKQLQIVTRVMKLIGIEGYWGLLGS